jgi:PAS domain S-box-containing protein
MASRNSRRATITTDPAPEACEPGDPFRRAFERAPIGAVVLEWDGAFRLVAANRAWCDMLGYTEDELLAADWHLVTHPGEHVGEDARTHDLVTGALDGYRLEKVCVRKDGTTFPAAVHIAAVRDDDGSLTHAIAFLDDIEARERDEQRLRAATAASFDAFMFFDALRDESGAVVDFVVEHANDAACDERGIARDELVGRTLGELCPGFVGSAEFRWFRQVLEAGTADSRTLEGDVRVAPVDGGRVVVTWP